MSYEGTPVKAPPSTRRRMMPPTPQQISHSSTDERQWQSDLGLEAQRSIWSSRERTVIAGMENDLEKSDDMKSEIEELQLLMDPEDSKVNLRYILARMQGGKAAGFSRSPVRKRKLTTWWQAETVGWSTKVRGSRTK